MTRRASNSRDGEHLSPEEMSSLEREYRVLVDRGSAGSAFVRLGEAWVSIPSGDDASREFIRGLVDAESADAAVRDAVTKRKRAEHVLSIGSSFNQDEMVLLLTLRTEIELIARVLRLFGKDVTALRLDAIDARLSEAALDSGNRSALRSALASLRRNWKVPVVDVWTRSNVGHD